MQLQTEKPGGLNAEIKIIPYWAWTVAVLGFVCAQLFFTLLMGNQSDAPSLWLRSLLGLLAGVILGGYVLFVGYVNRDASRRGMSSVLWTAIAILIPNGLGIILFFILRQPLRRICPQCGAAIQSGFNFCPACSHKLSLSCPNCQRLVGAADVYCSFCGTSLHNPSPSGVGAANLGDPR